MITQKIFIVYLSILLAFCTVLAGCALSPSTETTQSSTDSMTGSNDIFETSNSNETREPSTDPSTTITSAPTETPAVTTAATKAPTKKPTVTASTTKAPTTKAPTTAAVPSKPSAIVLDTLLGQSQTSITHQFGNPFAIEKSEYGFNWYVYHKNYANFVMIGIQNGKVVGLYSNSAALKFGNVTVGASRSNVRASLKGYTGPLASIVKGNTEYKLPMPEQRDVFTDGQKYVTTFYDNIRGRILTAIQIIDYSTEQSFGLYPAPDKGFTDSYERISFYLINSIRVRFGKPTLQYDNRIAGIAAAHSQDMIDHSYFSHTSSGGLDLGQRIEAEGCNFRSCAENIAENYPGAISAHENYMNSAEHRVNILGDYKFVGVGVRMVYRNILQTEDFVTYS